MQFYFAPMEGVTGAMYRRVHRRHFPGVDKYFMPFVSPGQEHNLTRRDLRELAPERNEGIPVVPQLMTKRVEDFNWAAGALAGMGYGEINLNLGCPSGTVVAKGKGSGFLADPAGLDRFLEEIFRRPAVRISVKTRLGLKDPEEFGPLLEIFNRYPIWELIIHPRVRTDFYKNAVNRGAFAAALEESRNPVCYNGDLVTQEDMADVRQAFPGVERVMIGRGLVANPALLCPERCTKAALRAFHDELYAAYCDAFGSEGNAMLRMKEVWFYMIGLFGDHERLAKRLRKTTDVGEYRAVVASIFGDLPLLADTVAGW